MKVIYMLITILSGVLLTSSTTETTSAKTIILKRVKSYKLSPKQLNSMKKAKSKGYFMITGKVILPAKGRYLYTTRNKSGNDVIFVVNKKPGVQLKDHLTVEITPFFEIVGVGPSLILFCSCGTNDTQQAGDHCRSYINGQIFDCRGDCSGGLSDSNCSFTGIYLDTGDILNP